MDLHNAHARGDGHDDVDLPMNQSVPGADEQHRHTLPQCEGVACQDSGHQRPQHPPRRSEAGDYEDDREPRRRDEGPEAHGGHDEVYLREVPCNSVNGSVVDSWCLGHCQDHHDHAEDDASQGADLQRLHALAQYDPAEDPEENQGGRTKGAEHGLRRPGHRHEVQDLARDVDREAEDPPRLPVEGAACSGSSILQVRVLLQDEAERDEEAASRAAEHAQEPHDCCDLSAE
mmetsp:Transcript_76675/g.171538  ORF Transcript_76675/g.171538 Transcript_76675/m.171538 type:complete len:231 (-) Transcript_76675:133-825(-)